MAITQSWVVERIFYRIDDNYPTEAIISCVSTDGDKIAKQSFIFDNTELRTQSDGFVVYQDMTEAIALSWNTKTPLEIQTIENNVSAKLTAILALPKSDLQVTDYGPDPSNYDEDPISHSWGLPWVPVSGDGYPWNPEYYLPTTVGLPGEFLISDGPGNTLIWTTDPHPIDQLWNYLDDGGAPGTEDQVLTIIGGVATWAENPLQDLQSVLDTGNTATEDINLTGNFTIDGDTVQTGDVTLTGDTVITGNQQITGNTELTGNSNHVGNTIHNGDLTQVGDQNITGDVTHVGNLDRTGNEIVIGDTTQTGDIDLTGDSAQTGNSTQTGDSAQTGNQNLIGNDIQVGNTAQTGDVNLTGTYTHIGDIDITGNTTQTGDVMLTGNTTQVGDVNLTGDTTINGDTTQTGDTTLTGDSTQTGDVNLTGDVTHVGDTIQTGNLTNDSIVSPIITTDTITVNTSIIDSTGSAGTEGQVLTSISGELVYTDNIHPEDKLWDYLDSAGAAATAGQVITMDASGNMVWEDNVHPDDIAWDYLDSAGAAATAGQVITMDGNGDMVWGDNPPQDLQSVLDTGNTATQDINLTGTITVGNSIIAGDKIETTDIQVNNSFIDSMGASGNDGQVLVSWQNKIVYANYIDDEWNWLDSFGNAATDPKHYLGVDPNTLETKWKLAAYDGDVLRTGNIDITDPAPVIGVESTLSNLYIGSSVEDQISKGTNNTVLGMGAMATPNLGNNTVAIGAFAGWQTQNGIGNTFVGSQAGRNSNNVSGNIYIGKDAGYTNTSGSNNVIVGGGETSMATGSSTGSYNTHIGVDTIPSSSSASYETVIGHGAEGIGSNTTIIGTDDTTAAVIKGLRKPSIVLSGAYTRTLTLAESGSVISMQPADGAKITLPECSVDNVGVFYEMYMLGNPANYAFIETSKSTEYISGCVDIVKGSAAASDNAVAGDFHRSVFIHKNNKYIGFRYGYNNNSGGFTAGTTVKFTCVSPNLWSIEGKLASSTSGNSPIYTGSRFPFYK